MAIYHLSVKPISRAKGRSATAAAAYRAGCRIVDSRTGEIHNYQRKQGVEHAEIILPSGAPEWAKDREQLWNAAEHAERRKDACVAREFEVALPAELSPDARRKLALSFAQEMANSEGCGVDVAIHAPNPAGDQRNYHAHIMRTTRKIETDGLGEKLDTEKAGRNRLNDLENIRQRWALLVNEHLKEHGYSERVDPRRLEEQGIERKASQHLGPSAIGYERRTGLVSEKRLHQEEHRTEQAQNKQKLEQAISIHEQRINTLTKDIKKAQYVHEISQHPEIQKGLDQAREAFLQRKTEHEQKQKSLHLEQSPTKEQELKTPSIKSHDYGEFER